MLPETKLDLSAHDGHADEDCGGDDSDLGEEEDEGAHGVDGRHPHHVRRQHLEGAPRGRAEVVAVYRWVVAQEISEQFHCFAITDNII